MLLMPSPLFPGIAYFTRNATATAPITFVARLTVKLSTDNENTMPKPYSSHLLNNDFVAWNNRHMMNKGPKPTNSAIPILFNSSSEPPPRRGLPFPPR